MIATSIYAPADIATRRRHLTEWLALGAYLCLGIVLLLHHETWLDEIDTWLVARDAPLSRLPVVLGRAGTPTLWYLILMPFARAGFSYLTQPVIHLLIASASAAIFLFRAPFTRLFKLLFLFSYYMGFEYLAVARNYALMIALMFALAALYPNRERRPIAFAVVFALLVNTSVHALLIGVVLGPMFAWHFLMRRTPRRWPAIAIMAAGGVCSGLPMYLARSRALVEPFTNAGVSARMAVYGIARAFIPIWSTPAAGASPMLGAAFWTAVQIAAVVLTAVILLCASVVIAKDRTALAALWLSYAALVFIIACVYWGGLRHSGLFLIALVFVLWIAEAGKDPTLPSRVLALTLYASLFVALLCAARYWRLDIRYPFSGSKDLASYLKANHLEQRPIVTTGYWGESVLAYLPPRTLWYGALNRSGSYCEWDVSNLQAGAIPENLLAKRALQSFKNTPGLLLLANEPLSSTSGLRLLYATQGPVIGNLDERFWLYAREGE